MKSEDLILWLDLETTGLDPDRDHVLEFACVLTDNNLERLYAYTAVVMPPAGWTTRLNPHVQKMHDESGLLGDVINNLDSCMYPHHLDRTVASAIHNVTEQPVTLAGNNVGTFDRRFLRRKFPMVESLCHHRHLDCSTLWEAMRRAFGHDRPTYPHGTPHRAADDVNYSIHMYKEWRNATALGVRDDAD